MTGRILRFQRYRALHLALACACAVVSAAGCGGEKAEPAMPADAVTKTATEGPVTLSLTASGTEVDYTSKIEVRIEAKAEPGVDVHLENYGEALREAGLVFEMRVVDAKEAHPGPDGPNVEKATYTLAFVLPGEYELPPASASFTGASDTESGSGEGESGGEEQEVPTLRHVSTEAIPVVARDPANKGVTPEELSKITVLDPRELPTFMSRWWWTIPAGLATLAVILLITVPRLRRWLRRRWLERPKPAPPPIPADVWARQQLTALIAEHLLDRGLLQEFHYRVSFIVRGYIERRYGVTAGEMTTEEFLAAAVADARFGPDITEELRRFLATCDMVKYARHEPSGDESSGALQAAESFVDRTSGPDPTATSPAGTAEANPEHGG